MTKQPALKVKKVLLDWEQGDDLAVANSKTLGMGGYRNTFVLRGKLDLNPDNTLLLGNETILKKVSVFSCKTILIKALCFLTNLISLLVMDQFIRNLVTIVFELL